MQNLIKVNQSSCLNSYEHKNEIEVILIKQNRILQQNSENDTIKWQRQANRTLEHNFSKECVQWS